MTENPKVAIFSKSNCSELILLGPITLHRALPFWIHLLWGSDGSAKNHSKAQIQSHFLGKKRLARLAKEFADNQTSQAKILKTKETSRGGGSVADTQLSWVTWIPVLYFSDMLKVPAIISTIFHQLRGNNHRQLPSSIRCYVGATFH